MVRSTVIKENQRQSMVMDQLYRVQPMRLFATWETDRTSSNCVPRLCTMSLNRLTVFKVLESDLNCVVIAVKLQGYKRTLRSNDVSVQFVNGTIDVDLDISFTLQYPHFIKKRNNNLLIMLQRRKKYKGRPIPGGFKTLALGMVNLSEVLQSASTQKDIPLYSDLSDVELNDVASPSSYPPHRTPAAAKLYLHVLSSQPLEQDETKVKEQHSCTDEEDDESTANEDGAGGSDSEPSPGAVGDESGAGTARSGSSKTNFFATASTKRLVGRQKNLKQKFVAILKKFKISEEEVLKAVDPHSQQPTEQEIRDLFDELDNYSNSDQEPDADTVSVKSTPKPSLRPYFSSLASSREVLPTADDKDGCKESEDSKESGGDSHGDLDTTDQEIAEAMAPSANGVHVAATASANSVIATTPKPTSTRREPLRTAATLPGAHSADRRKEAFPANRQVSADILQTSTTSESKSTGAGVRQQSMIERSQFTSSASIGHRSRGFGRTGEIPGPISMCQSSLLHKAIGEQLTQIFLSTDDKINLVPESILILSAIDIQCQNLVDRLGEKITSKFVVVSSQADVKALFNALVNRIQKYCNTNAFQTQNAVKLILMGGDRFLAYCLKSYTEIFAQKSNDWLHYVRFFVVGSSWSVVGRCLSNFDHTYSFLFNDSFWRDWWDKAELSQQEISDVINRVLRYVQNAKLTLPLPIAEAMLQLKDKGTGDEMCHIFVPFVVEVRRAAGENLGGDATAETLPHSPVPSGQQSTAIGQSTSGGSPPNTATCISPRGFSINVGDVFSNAAHGSPPGSPHFLERSNISIISAGEAQDLQIEYWTPAGASSSLQAFAPGFAGLTQKKDSTGGAVTITANSASTSNSASGSNAPTKYSLKTSFKSLVITRFPSNASALSGDAPASSPSLMVQFVKEKKKDKMLQKLGMKNKEKIESEQKCQSIEGINRLICSAKQHATMKLNVDGVEWTNVKFFQISSQWQTHVKVMPIALFHIDL